MLRILFVTLALTILGAGAVSADDRSVTDRSFEAWHYVCDASSKPETCAILQSMSVKDDDTTWVDAFVYVNDKHELKMTFRMTPKARARGSIYVNVVRPHGAVRDNDEGYLSLACDAAICVSEEVGREWISSVLENAEAIQLAFFVSDTRAMYGSVMVAGLKEALEELMKHP